MNERILGGAWLLTFVTIVFGAIASNIGVTDFSIVMYVHLAVFGIAFMLILWNLFTVSTEHTIANRFQIVFASIALLCVIVMAVWMTPGTQFLFAYAGHVDVPLTLLITFLAVQVGLLIAMNPPHADVLDEKGFGAAELLLIVVVVAGFLEVGFGKSEVASLIVAPVCVLAVILIYYFRVFRKREQRPPTT